MRCEACDRPMSHRSRGVIGICYPCRQLAATFARAWMVDLASQGLKQREIAEIIGTTRNSVHSRLGEIRRGVTP